MANTKNKSSTCNEIEDYKANEFDYKNVGRDMECEKDFNNHLDIKNAKESIESPNKNLNMEDAFFKQVEEDSNGCGEEGLYSCPIHPQLDLMREEAINKTLKKFKREYKLSHIPTEVLISEVRKRQLEIPLTGSLTINKDGSVNFQIDTLSWPTGVYNVNITCSKDLGKTKEG